MNRTFIIISTIVSVSFFSCGSSGDKHIEVKNSTESVKTEKTAQVETIDVPSAVKHISQLEFSEKIFDYKTQTEWNFKGTKPCIVDFYADWCKPCKVLAPIYEKLAAKYEGKVDFYKINVDHNKELAGAFRVNSIPTVLFCPMGEQPQMSMGALPEAELEKAINTVLLKE